MDGGWFPSETGVFGMEKVPEEKSKEKEEICTKLCGFFFEQ